MIITRPSVVFTVESEIRVVCTRSIYLIIFVVYNFSNIFDQKNREMELYTLIKIHLGGSQNCLEYIYVQNFTTIDGKFLSASSEQWGLNLFQKLTKMATKDWPHNLENIITKSDVARHIAGGPSVQTKTSKVRSYHLFAVK